MMMKTCSSSSTKIIVGAKFDSFFNGRHNKFFFKKKNIYLVEEKKKSNGLINSVEEIAFESERNANFNLVQKTLFVFVFFFCAVLMLEFFCYRGLDNAGKTTVVKKFNNEPIDTISPTLGFNIQTLEYKGFVVVLTCCVYVCVRVCV